MGSIPIRATSSVVPLRKEILIKHEAVKSNNRFTTQRTSHPQHSQVVELVDTEFSVTDIDR